MSAGGPGPAPSPAAASPKLTRGEMLVMARGFLLPTTLIALVYFTVARHFDPLGGIVGLAAGLGVLAKASNTVWKALVEPTFKSKMGQLLLWLGQRERMIRMGVAGVAVVIAGSLLASVHVNGIDRDFTAQNSAVWIYRMVSPVGAPHLARKMDSVLLEQNSVHAHFRALPLPGRNTWMLSSTFLRTPDFALWPWSSRHLGFPGRFERVMSVALLLTQNFAPEIGPGRPLRITVHNDSSKVLIANDSLIARGPTGVPSVLLSVAPPPAPDAATVARWQLELRKRFPGDSLPVHVRGWKDKQFWLHPTGPLAVGQRLRVEVARSDGTVLGSRVVTLTDVDSHVLISLDQ